MNTRRKCDQLKPKCTLCNKRKEECIWPEGDLTFKNQPRKKKNKFINISSASLKYISKIPRDDDFENDTLEVDPKTPMDLILAKQSDLSTDHEIEDTSPYMESLFRGENSPSEFANINIGNIENNSGFLGSGYYNFLLPQIETTLPLISSLSYPFPIALSSIEKQYIYYYCAYIAHAISVVPKQLNYFLNTFLPMATKEKTVLYCLLAWGSIFKTYKEEGILLLSTGQKYIQKAIKSLKNLPDGKFSFIYALTSYIILMCVEITIGDIAAWSSYLTECYNLINRMGGFHILKNYSSEGKILAQNFAYFDILASQSNENGTYYPVAEYVEIYNSEDVALADSLQGCIRPLILILGEAINLLVESKKLLDHVLDKDLFHEHQGLILEKCDQLEKDLEEAQLNPLDLIVLNESDDMETHLQMFELYQLSIKLYIKHVIRRLPPVVPEMQFIFYKIKKYLRILMNSSVKMSLCFPLLISGLVAVTLKDRKELESLIIEFKSQYEFDNAKKIHFILKEIWNLNENGTLYVDWFNVTKKFGWRLNLGR